VSCMIGAGLSGIFPNLPSGAMIVLTAAILFVTSMLLGSARGVLIRAIRRQQWNRRIDRQHVLRGIYELLEKQSGVATSGANTLTNAVLVSELLKMRSWSARRLDQQLLACEREGWLIRRRSERNVVLTAVGVREA